MGLASLGCGMGIFCGSLYSVFLCNAVSGLDFLRARPVAAAGAMLREVDAQEAGCVGGKYLIIQPLIQLLIQISI